MDQDFWHQRWADNQLGFHQSSFNAHLLQHWSRLELQQNARVFVPLCGKSLDMLWLADQGFRIFGVELSVRACRDFFVENDIAFESVRHNPFERITGNRIELWAGDFFALTAEDLHDVVGVYDRASLISFPDEARAEYANHLAKLLSPGACMLLVSMEYEQHKMQGPPFSVVEDEVRALFGDRFSVDLVDESSAPELVGGLSKRGLDRLTEKVYLLVRE